MKKNFHCRYFIRFGLFFVCCCLFLIIAQIVWNKEYLNTNFIEASVFETFSVENVESNQSEIIDALPNYYSELEEIFENVAINFIKNFNRSLFEINDKSNANRTNFLNDFVARKTNFSSGLTKDTYYVAAVIDYSGIAVADYQLTVNINVQKYVKIIKECHKYNVDIVVFPESGIYNYMVEKETILKSAVIIPSAEELVVPCTTRRYTDVMTKLSCAAQQNNIYVVVNVMEKFCPKANQLCLKYEYLLYNTEVVFDRKGTIIARYRKYNLYTERWYQGMSQTAEVELVTFTSDFNVTFGIAVCFDLFFENPGVTLVQKYNITNILYSAMMQTRLPFLAVSSIEAGWSYSMNVNLLASSFPGPGSVFGSNIYFGRRKFAQSYFVNYDFSKIIVAPVPKHGANFSYEFSQVYKNFKKYEPDGKKEMITLVEHVLGSIEMKPLFDEKPSNNKIYSFRGNSFECNVSVLWESITNRSLPNYQIMSFAGLNNYSVSSLNNYVEMCGLALCSGKNFKTCNLPPHFDDSSKINIISLDIFATSKNTLDVRIPVTLNSKLGTLNVTDFSFSNFNKMENGNEINYVRMILNKPVTNLVAFGVYKFPEISKPMPRYNVLDDLKNTELRI